MFLRILAIVFTLLFATGSNADDSSARLDQLFEVAKVEQIFRAYDGFIIDEFLEDDEFIGDLERQELLALGNRHFAASVLTKDLRERIDGRLTASEIDQNIAFFGSPLGQRITSAEAASALVDDEISEARGSELLVDLQHNNPTRVALIEEFIEHLQLVDALKRGAMNILYALTKLSNNHPSNPAPLSDDQVAELANEIGQEFLWEVEHLVLSSHAFTYNGLSDAEIAQYIRFLKTPAGKTFYLAWQDEEIDIISRRSLLLVNGVLDLMMQKRS